MNPHVTSINVDLFQGILTGIISFTSKLNILSGENGTGKTRLLTEIKAGSKIQSSSTTAPRIQAFSPKRNSERKTIQSIIQEIRHPNRRFTNYIQTLTQAAFQDSTFVNYPSFGEVYLLVYEEECKDGGNQKQKMSKVTDDFNGIIRRIFDNYELLSDWDNASGSPNIRLKKNDSEIPIESLSLGEQEILSLVINLYATRDSHDVFLIDEPEIHLNWHLEEALFRFLDWFCNEYEKQLIVATHSRVVFTTSFLSKTQFLFWYNGKINTGKNLPDSLRQRIAGESIDIIQVGTFSKVTFFVEDIKHLEVIDGLASALGCEITSNICGNSNNVRSLYKLSLIQGWENCYFIIDGDNEGNPFPGEKQFIHLGRYCIENYLLDISTAAKVTKKSEEAVKNAIVSSIKTNKDKILSRNKFFAFFSFVFDSLDTSNIKESSLEVLDGSTILDTFLSELNINPNQYIQEYMKILVKESRLNDIFPEELILAITQK